MKKLLMTAAILAVGATAYANISTPVNVSLDVITTSNIVLMDGSTQLTQIDLAHPQMLLASAKTANTSSVVSKTFTVQTGDGSEIQFNGTNGATVSYELAGVGTNGKLTLRNGSGEDLASTLALSRTADQVQAGAAAPANTITSTIAPDDLNAISDATGTGTYTGAATLNVTLAAL